MEQKDIQAIIDGLSRSIEDRVVEAVYEQQKHKDAEVSALHRQINERLKDQGELMEKMSATVEDHNDFIDELRQIVKTAGFLKKSILWVLIFVPMVSAFFAAARYIYEIIKH